MPVTSFEMLLCVQLVDLPGITKVPVGNQPSNIQVSGSGRFSVAKPFVFPSARRS